jgi:type I restriction enzyme S subunit
MKQEIKERVERIRNVEVPEGYKKTKVGIIPDDWEVKKLAEVADVKTGPFGSALHEKDYVKDGTPIITVEHLGEQGVVHDNLPMVSDFDRNRLKSYVLKTGDIVFSRVGSVDRNSLIKETENGWLFSGRLLRIRVTTANISPSYLSYHFHQEITKQKIRSVAVGQTMASLNTQILKDIHVSFPPTRPEQQKITEILSTWDKAIELKEKLIEAKKEFKRGLMQKLLAGDMRFCEFNDQWDEVKLKEFLEEKGIRNENDQVKTVLSVNNKRGFINQDEQFDKRVASADASNYKIVKNGQFAYNPSRINVGSIDLLKTFEEGILSPMYVVFETKKELNSDYLRYWLDTHEFKGRMKCFISGSVRNSLGFKDFCAMKFKYPKIEEQEKIVEFLKIVDNDILIIVNELSQLNKQKKGLMQLLLTGIVRVNS